MREIPVHYTGDTPELFLTFWSQVSAPVRYGRVEFLIFFPKPLASVIEFSCIVGVEQDLVDLLVYVIGEGEPGPVPSEIADIEWLVSRRRRADLVLSKGIHAVVRAESCRVFHQFSPGVVPGNRLFYAIFRLDCFPPLESGNLLR